MTVYVTHGAKKNVGDYLIHDRGLRLLAHVNPDLPVRSVARWSEDPLPDDAHLLLMCGGPGVATRMIDRIFPVAAGAIERGIPLAGLALGWSGKPAKNPDAFQMTSESVDALKAVVAAGRPLTVRDDLSLGILQRLGVDAVRSGCTAWYSVQDLGAPARVVADPKRVVFTTPANTDNTREAIAVMRRLKRRFPKAQLIASFHRGILPDSRTAPHRSSALIAQAIAAKALGYKVLDVSYDLAKIDFYRETDLHVGYRVHAHLAYMSQRIPSVLISEDGRGAGQAVTLNGADSVLWAGSEALVDRVDELIGAELAAGWPSLTRAIDEIERSYPVMRDAILALPKK